MLSHQTLRRQILISALIALLGLVAVFGLLSVASFRAQAAPSVREVFWQIDDQSISVARLGEKVEAHVVVAATEISVGSTVDKVRKDTRFWLDSDYHISTFPVNPRGGEEKEMHVAFTPDEASGGNLRGYFIEIEFRATRTTWTMENSYPPRLRVIEKNRQ